MPAYCAVADCSNSLYSAKGSDSPKSVILHKFPRPNSVNYNQWVNCCKRGDKFNPATSFICSAHFTNADYKRDLKHELLGLPPRRILRLETGSIPTLFPNRATCSQTISTFIDNRKILDAKSRRKEVVAELINSKKINWQQIR